MHGALREIEEETGREPEVIYSLVNCLYPSGTELYVYYGIVQANEVQQVGDEKLEWFSVNDVLSAIVSDERFAGDGNVQYFINAALIELQNR
jgi:8-oxo-dGTP pyrophosphatase MutT (NUDIX family)